MNAYDHVSTAAARLAEARATLPPGALELACHAAVPVAVDPALLNLLRINFFIDPPHDLPWTVEAALLTSPLFRELGGDLYEIDEDLRRHLLVSLRTAYPPDRAVQVALLLERYGDQPGVWGAHPFLEQAQQLTAIGIIDPPAASQWLEDSARDPAARVGLSKDWFVAMRSRLERQPDPSRSLTDEIAEAAGRLPADAAVQRLTELGLLPGADVNRIRAALRPVTSDAAAGALRVLDQFAPGAPAVTFDGTARPVPLTDLLGMPYPEPFDPDRQWAPRAGLSVPFAVDPNGAPVRLDLDVDGPGLLTAVDGTGRRELLRTIVLALAATHAPDQLTMVLIDASGAKTFDRLSALPHVTGFHPGAVTRIGARRLMDDLDRELLSRSAARPDDRRPRLVVIVDEFVHLASRTERFGDSLLRDDVPGVSMLVAVSGYPADFHDLEGRRPGYRIDLGSGSSTQAGHGTFTTDRRNQFFAAATFMKRGPDDTVGDWLVQHMVGLGTASSRILDPVPIRRPELLDLLGTPQQVKGRGLTVDLPDPQRPMRGLAGIVGRPYGGGYDPFWVDLSAANLAVVGRAPTTTTDVLLAVVLSLALLRTPREVQFVIIDGSGGPTPLTVLPHVLYNADAGLVEPRIAVDMVLEILQRRAEDAAATGSAEGHVVLVINHWAGAREIRQDLAAIAEDGPRHGVHVLATATSWEDFAIPPRFATVIELELDHPATSVIDPDRAAELPSETLDTGLALGGEPFIPALIGGGPFRNDTAAAALASRIVRSWDGPTARDLRVPPVAPRDYFYLSHHRDGSLDYVRQLYRDLGAAVRRLDFLGDEPQVGTATFAWLAGEKGTGQIEQTLRVCQTFISVDDPGYFRSPHCAREWNLFHQRHGATAVTKVVSVSEPDLRYPRDLAYRKLVDRLAAQIVANAAARPVAPAAALTRLDQMPATFPVPGRRFALVIGTTRYVDSVLKNLAGAVPLAGQMADVLAAPDLGGYTVTTLLDASADEIRRTIEDVLGQREPDDHVLVYLIGHSRRDERGRLVFAATDTDHRELDRTGIDSDWLFRRLDDCRAGSQGVILDCYAESRGSAADVARPARRLTGPAPSRIVLTATGLPGDDQILTVTAALVRGLRSSAITLDDQGRVTFVAAYSYAAELARRATAGPTITMDVYDAAQDLILAPAPRKRELG